MRIDIQQLEYVHPMLREILGWVEEHAMEEEPVITSQYRIGDSGVHGTLPLRAHDIRCHDVHVGRSVEKKVNDRWVYDPNRPSMKVCMFHDSGGGWHLHFQVHSKTRRRGPSE